MVLIAGYNDCGDSICNHAYSLSDNRITLIAGTFIFCRLNDALFSPLCTFACFLPDGYIDNAERNGDN